MNNIHSAIENFEDFDIIMTEEDEAMGKPNNLVSWTGGDCPVNENCTVLYQMRDGDRCEDRAGNLNWNNRGKFNDIVSYAIKMRVYAGEDDYRQQQPVQAAPHNKYQREIKPGVHVDVYDVLQAWGVSNPALQHLIKKALQPGERGHKSKAEDMADIVASALRAEKLEGGE